jgi:hypothetical protein
MFDHGNRSVRHCDYQAYANLVSRGVNDDFHWNIVAALNGNASAISFQSVNFPGWIARTLHFVFNDCDLVAMFLAPVTSAESGRLGLITPSSHDAASFLPVSCSTAANCFQFVSIEPAGQYISLSPQLVGSCSKE